MTIMQGQGIINPLGEKYESGSALEMEREWRMRRLALAEQILSLWLSFMVYSLDIFRAWNKKKKRKEDEKGERGISGERQISSLTLFSPAWGCMRVTKRQV